MESGEVLVVTILLIPTRGSGRGVLPVLLARIALAVSLQLVALGSFQDSVLWVLVAHNWVAVDVERCTEEEGGQKTPNWNDIPRLLSRLLGHDSFQISSDHITCNSE